VPRTAYLGALGLRYALRAVMPGGEEEARLRRASARLSLQTLYGLREPPFGPPPPTAVAPREADGGRRAGQAARPAEE
jgi:hypothetical protein